MAMYSPGGAEAVEAGHVQVRQDYIRLEALELFERLVAFRRSLGGHPPSGYHGSQTGSLADLVVYNQDFQWLVQDFQSWNPSQGGFISILSR
jgi:hypothetical protein